MHSKDKDRDAGEVAERICVSTILQILIDICVFSIMLAASKHFLTRGVSLCNIKD